MDHTSCRAATVTSSQPARGATWCSPSILPVLVRARACVCRVVVLPLRQQSLCNPSLSLRMANLRTHTQLTPHTTTTASATLPCPRNTPIAEPTLWDTTSQQKRRCRSRTCGACHPPHSVSCNSHPPLTHTTRQSTLSFVMPRAAQRILSSLTPLRSPFLSVENHRDRIMYVTTKFAEDLATKLLQRCGSHRIAAPCCSQPPHHPVILTVQSPPPEPASHSKQLTFPFISRTSSRFFRPHRLAHCTILQWSDGVNKAVD